MNLYSVSIRFDEPSFATLIIPGVDEEEANKTVLEMTRDLKNVVVVQTVDTNHVEGMNELVNKNNANVVDFKPKKDLN